MEYGERQTLFLDAFPEAIGTSLSSEEHYNWKFRSFPAKPSAYEYAHHINGELIGYYAALPFKYSIAGKTMTAAMVCDVMTHSKARGKGVFTRIGRESLEDLTQKALDFSTGYPIRKEVLPGHLKVGWKVAFELPMYFRFHRVNSLAPSFLNVFFKIYNFVLDLIFLKSDCETELKNLEQALADPSFLDFVSQWSRQYPNHLIKSADFFRWRFSAPKTQYHFLLVKKHGELQGVAIARSVVHQKIPCLAILDLMTLNSKPVENALFQKLIEICRTHKDQAITVMMSRFNFRQHGLFRFGFIKSPLSFKLIIKELSEQAKARQHQLHQEKDWHLMWVDSDDL